jgi:hypothetical protein
MTDAKQAWIEWANAREALGAPDSEPDAFTAGWDAAVQVFTEKYFGGPTRDMVLGWWADARVSWDTALEQERESFPPDGES